jgi:hypothetical protein
MVLSVGLTLLVLRGVVQNAKRKSLDNTASVSTPFTSLVTDYPIIPYYVK